MARTLADFGRDLSKLTDGAAIRRVVQAGGMAGKEAVQDAAASDLGSDRAFSKMRRKVPLSTGFDVEGDESVRIKFRPPGLWVLAESGRKREGPIYPRAGSRKGRGAVRGRAVMTPQGPRARSSFKPSRGLNTYSDAVQGARRKVPKAAAKQFTEEVRKVARG